MLEETINDTEYKIEYSKDKDAKVGHKTADTSFFGYKTHIAMTPERIITAAVVTSGEKHDGKQLQKLVEKSQANCIEVKAVIGDGAYSKKENIEYCEENNIKLASKLRKIVTYGNSQRNNDFEYNKDAGMYVCKVGHMAIRKAKQGSKKSKRGDNLQVECYYFDIEKWIEMSIYYFDFWLIVRKNSELEKISKFAIFFLIFQQPQKTIGTFCAFLLLEY